MIATYEGKTVSFKPDDGLSKGIQKFQIVNGTWEQLVKRYNIKE